MRPWFAVFLWALLLLQPGWAAMGAGEVRSGEPVALHHCPHAHAPCDAPTTVAADADHADCGTCHNTCHNTCSIALLGTRPPAVAVPAAFPWPRVTPPPASHPADLPERPQWAAPATA